MPYKCCVQCKDSVGTAFTAINPTKSLVAAYVTGAPSYLMKYNDDLTGTFELPSDNDIPVILRAD
jgi:hypothetical protein